MPSDGFMTCLSLAVTRPASIAACARARLSNRPRSTSNRSERLRGGGKVGSPLAKSTSTHRRAWRLLARLPCARKSRTRLARYRRRQAGKRRVLPRKLLSFRDAPTDLGFTRVRQYYCPSRQQLTWMRRPGIHTSSHGYGFRARLFHWRPMTQDLRSGQLHRFGLEILAERFEHL